MTTDWVEQDLMPSLLWTMQANDLSDFVEKR